MKKYLIIILSLILSEQAFTQNADLYSISGTVIDSAAKNPLQFATITLFPKGNKKPSNGAITDAAGNFKIDDVKEGVFTVVIESIGYNAITFNNIMLNQQQAVKNFETILLVASTKTLEAVAITSRVSTIENKIDRLVFNVEKDISSQGGTASDVLKKVPQVSVDAEGNVQLAGSSGVRFLINGKPSTAFGNSVADVLQSIPASQIKSIEVITNPGAKYDAQGMGGIINIIFKNNKQRGYNGNLSLTGGTRQENGSLNLNFRNKDFGVNAFVSGSKSLKNTVPFYSERNTTNGAGIDYLRQDGSSEDQRQGVQTGAGFDWTVKKLNSFSGSVGFYDYRNKRVGNTIQDLQIDKGSSIPPVLTQLDNANNSKFKSTELSFNYKRTFAKEDRELELGVNSSLGNGRRITSNEQTALPQNFVKYAAQSVNPSRTSETQINLDYTEPISENFVLGTGGKISFNNIKTSSSALQLDQNTQTFVPDNSLSTSLTYNQKVYAAYGELSFPLFAGIKGKAGARYERTEINAFFSDAQQQKKIPGYNTLVPSVYFSKKINAQQSLKINYSKRIERPDYGDLNPFVNTSDPQNLSTGNPFLLPEIGHRIELGYNRDFGKVGSAALSLFYRINQNDIQDYLIYYPSYQVGDSVYTNVSVSSAQNIGSEKNTGINLFNDFKVTPKLALRSNISGYLRHTINVIDKGFNTNSFNYRLNLNATYQIDSSFTGEFFGSFRSARNEAQGIYPSSAFYTIALRKQFWNKKGSLALTANNVLAKYLDQKTRLFGPGYNSVSLRQIPYRSIGLNFTWKFGKLEFKKDEGNDVASPPAE